MYKITVIYLFFALFNSCAFAVDEVFFKNHELLTNKLENERMN
jgi:hypothetical protein